MAAGAPLSRHRPALQRAVIFTPGLYALLIGGTFTGLTIVRLQRISLALLSVAALAWLATLWMSSRPVRLGAPFGPVIAAWAAVFAVSAAITGPSGRTMIALWYMALYAGLWLLISDLRQRGFPPAAFSEALLIGALPLIFWALLQALPWFPRWFAVRDLGVPFFPPRPVGTFGNTNLLAAYLALALPLGIARWLSLPDRFGRALMALWTALALGTLYLTYSRGAWLATASSLAAFAALAYDRPAGRQWSAGFRWRGRTARAWSLMVLALIASVAALALAGNLAWRAFDSPQRDTGARLGYYSLALDRFRAQPWGGAGLFSFGRALSEAQSIPPAQPHAHAHNLALNVAAELGLPGLIALALTGYFLAREARRALRLARDRPARLQVAAAMASLTAIGVHSLVDMPLMAPSLVIAALFALAGGVAPVPAEPSRLRWRGWLSRTGASLLWGGILLIGWKGSLDYGRYVQGLSLVAAGDFHAGRAALETAADAQPSNTWYRAEFAYASGLAAGQGDRRAADQAVEAYRQALRAEPDQALWWANLAALQWNDGARAAAIGAMRQAVAVAPDAPDLWLNLGRFAETGGDSSTAMLSYSRALELAPRMAAAPFWRETALRRVALAAAPAGPLPEVVARRMWLAGDEDGAIALLRRTITRDPSQPRPAIEVARLALESGDLHRAEAYLEVAEVLGPIGQDAAWLALLRAEVAAARGDHARAAELRAQARAMTAPDLTGYPTIYGSDIAQFQFLSLTVPGKLLPQLLVLGPEPAVVEAAASE